MPSQNQLEDSVLDQLKCAEQEERNRKQKLISNLGGFLKENGGSSKKESHVRKLIKQISERRIRSLMLFDASSSPKSKQKRRHSSPTDGSPGFEALQNILDHHLRPLMAQTDPLHRRGNRNNAAGVSRRVSEQISLCEILDDSFFSTPVVKNEVLSISEQDVSSENVFIDNSLDTYYKDGKLCTWC